MTETPIQETAKATAGRTRRRELEAFVVQSGTQAKTVKVEVEFMTKHPRYNKYQRKRTRLQVHDENGEAKVGDKVQIAECRPISKSKNWRLVKVLEKAKV